MINHTSSSSICFIQSFAHASLGILKSPLGETATLPTFGPVSYTHLICAYVEKAEEISEENVEKLRLVQKLKLFLSQLTKFRDMAAYTPIHELILYILKDTGYGRYARAIPGGAQRGAKLHKMCIRDSRRPLRACSWMGDL